LKLTVEHIKYDGEITVFYNDIENCVKYKKFPKFKQLLRKT